MIKIYVYVATKVFVFLDSCSHKTKKNAVFAPRSAKFIVGLGLYNAEKASVSIPANAFFVWSWGESNPRPNSLPESFLHA